MAVVKADAYGHGIMSVAQTAVDAGLDFLGVALLEKALMLRQAGIISPILVFGIIALNSHLWGRGLPDTGILFCALAPHA